MMNDPKITRMEPHGPADTGMVEWDPIDPKSIESGSPVQRGHLYFNDADLGLMAGVWDCTPFTGTMAPYDVNEFMYVLEGSVTMVDERDSAQAIEKGLAADYEGSHVLFINEKDRELVQTTCLGRAIAAITSKGVPAPTVTIARLEDSGGHFDQEATGIIARTSDGHIEFDNTLQARMNRMEGHVRIIAFQSLLD